MRKLLFAAYALIGPALAFAQEQTALEKKGTLAESSLNSTTGIIQWLGTTLLVLALIFVIAYLLKKTQLMRFASSKNMTIMGQLSLGPKERLIHVRIGHQDLLIGVAANSINLICKLDGEEDSFRKEMEKASAGVYNFKDKATDGNEAVHTDAGQNNKDTDDTQPRQ